MQSAEKHFSEIIPEKDKEITEAEKPLIESILIESPLEEKPCLVLNTPYSRLDQHKVFRSQDGKLYLEKEDRSESKKAETIQEFIVSNSLRAMVKQLNLQEIVVPEIKISPERPGKYYCSYFENLHSFLEHTGTVNLINLFKKKLLRNDLLPLVLSHLVTGDLDRNTSNYGLLVEKDKPDKTLIFDFGEIVAQGGSTDALFHIIPAGLIEENFKKPIEMVKKLFSEEYINDLLTKSEASKNKISVKKRQILKNLENIDKLIKNLIEQKRKNEIEETEYREKIEEHTLSFNKKDKEVYNSLINSPDFNSIPRDKWKKIETIISNLQQLREEELKINQKVKEIKCYKDYQMLLEIQDKRHEQHSALYENYRAEISQFDEKLKDKLFFFYGSI